MCENRLMCRSGRDHVPDNRPFGNRSDEHASSQCPPLPSLVGACLMIPIWKNSLRFNASGSPSNRTESSGGLAKLLDNSDKNVESVLKIVLFWKGTQF